MCLLRDAVQCPEEHAFCSSCIHQYLATQGSECPECKTALTPETIRPWSRVLRNLLGELLLRCTYVSEGCTTVTSLFNIISHEATCPHGTRSCRHCRVIVAAKDLTSHEQGCEHRSMVCDQGCGLRVYPNRWPAHSCLASLKGM